MDQTAPRPAGIFALAPWRHLLGRVLGPALPVPTMLSGEEQQLYFWLTALWARGAGEIVDLGAFAGGSTARLALGHAAAGLTSGIHAYDRFTADEGAKRKFLYSAGIAPFSGNDILPLAQELLAPWAGAITFHPGEIEDIGWSGAPIEILVSDAAKSATAADAIAAAFFPALLPGRSVLVSQDQLQWNQPWLPAQMELLADFFTPVAHCAATTVVYLCTAAPDAAALERARTATLDDAALTALLEAARSRFGRFGCADRIDRMIAAVAANPRERTAWRFNRA